MNTPQLALGVLADKNAPRRLPLGDSGATVLVAPSPLLSRLTAAPPSEDAAG